jgi:3-hydroxybutyryl-CoA dehydratase
MMDSAYKPGSLLGSLSLEVTEEIIKRYGDVSGDHNPIHFDDNEAKKCGFSAKIVHGMLSMAIASKIIEPLLNEGIWIRQYNMKFIKPVFAGEKIKVSGSVSLVQDGQMLIHVQVSSPTYPQVAKGELSLQVYK